MWAYMWAYMRAETSRAWKLRGSRVAPVCRFRRVNVRVKMKREFDTIHMDRDTAHARRVNRTDFRGIGHPTLSLGSSRESVVWGVCGVPSHAPKN